jgi:hypothetical protein
VDAERTGCFNVKRNPVQNFKLQTSSKFQTTKSKFQINATPKAAIIVSEDMQDRQWFDALRMQDIFI